MFIWDRLEFKTNLRLLCLTMSILRGPLRMQHNVQTSVGRIPELLKNVLVLRLTNKVWRHQIPLMKSSTASPLTSLSGKTGWAYQKKGVGRRFQERFLVIRNEAGKPSCWFPQFSQTKTHGLAMMSSDMGRHAEARSCQADPGFWWKLGRFCNVRAMWVWSNISR